MLCVIIAIVSIIANIIFIIVLNKDLYTDSYFLPDEQRHYLVRSPYDTLYSADMAGWWKFQLFVTAICIISSFLIIFGVRHKIVKIVQIASAAASLIVFIIIMIICGNVNFTY